MCFAGEHRGNFPHCRFFRFHCIYCVNLFQWLCPRIYAAHLLLHRPIRQLLCRQRLQTKAPLEPDTTDFKNNDTKLHFADNQSHSVFENDSTAFLKEAQSKTVEYKYKT